MHINYRKQNKKSKRVQNIEMHKFQTNQNANSTKVCSEMNR